jgi:Cu(I)/Ag(I) efflux system protein CusF
MKTVRQTLIPLLAAAPLLLLHGLSYAQPARASAAANASAELTAGEIRKVDKENKKITIKHGPLTNVDGKITITKMEAAK